MFRRYTPDDFDKHGYLKAPIGFYLLLVVLLRPYIIWILSVANRKESTVLIESLYPVKSDFFMSLAIGFGAVLVFAFSSLRRKDAFGWLPTVWKASAGLLWITLLADFLSTLNVVKNAHFIFQNQHAAVFLGLFFAALYLYKSQRLADFLRDWPEDIVKEKEKEEEKKKEKGQEKQDEDKR